MHYLIIKVNMNKKAIVIGTVSTGVVGGCITAGIMYNSKAKAEKKEIRRIINDNVNSLHKGNIDLTLEIMTKCHNLKMLRELRVNLNTAIPAIPDADVETANRLLYNYLKETLLFIESKEEAWERLDESLRFYHLLMTLLDLASK